MKTTPPIVSGRNYDRIVFCRQNTILSDRIQFCRQNTILSDRIQFCQTEYNSVGQTQNCILSTDLYSVGQKCIPSNRIVFCPTELYSARQNCILSTEFQMLQTAPHLVLHVCRNYLRGPTQMKNEQEESVISSQQPRRSFIFFIQQRIQI